MFFKYGDKEMEYLKKCDEKLGRFIERTGKLKRPVNHNIFKALVESIVSQQISGKAAETVLKRLNDLAGGLSARDISRLTEDSIQKCGMTSKKARYIKSLADAELEKRIDLKALAPLPDEQIIKSLTALDGIGRWTAEMLLIFCFERPDVMSFSDLGIRRGIMRLYELDDLKKTDFETYRKRFSPYGSVASLYLWELADGNRK